MSVVCFQCSILLHFDARECEQNFSPRDEASSATAGNVTFVFGGVNDNSVEYIDMTDYDVSEGQSLDIKSTSVFFK